MGKKNMDIKPNPHTNYLDSHNVKDVGEIITEDGTDRTIAQPVLTTVHKLCQLLESEGISYCHWKSNNALERSASGENDLDLLISREDVNRFTELLYRLGFKRALAPKQKQIPGVLDYFGFDREADKIIHVHAHYQLVLGHDMTKNFRIPIEKHYLESVVQGTVFKIPAPEYEFVVFVIRMVLKHSTWDAILKHEGKFKPAELEEFSYLQAQVNMDRVYNILEKDLPYIGNELFDKCLDLLISRKSNFYRSKIGHQLQSALHPCARRTLALDFFVKIKRRLELAIRRRVFKSTPKFKLESGGVAIALVGGDGAGKSTAVSGVYNWLCNDFEIVQIHMGKPPRSIMTQLINIIRKFFRKFLTIVNKNSKNYILDNKINKNSSLVLKKNDYGRMMWDFSVGYDRYRNYKKMKRFSMNGGIVVCDRFPMPEDIKLMDAPRIGTSIDPKHMNWFTKFLSQKEKSWYKPISPPEIIIVLKLDPKIAVIRKTDEESSYVEFRSTEVWKADFQYTNAHILDASLPKDILLSIIKDLIWRQI